MRKDTTSLAKVTRPTLLGVYPRERLFHLLDRGCKKPMIWVSGPPGSGKTTLISSYIEARKLPTLWYRIDENDSDLEQFFHYMNLAAQKVIGKKSSSLPVYKKELKDIKRFAGSYYEEFYSRLKKAHFVMVFDNYQAVPEKSLFHKIIDVMLLKIPKGVTVIIISRKGMPSTLSRIRANYSPEILGWNELRLTKEESEEIIKRRLGEQSEEIMQSLLDRTDGWVAGLVLMLEGAKKEKLKPKLINNLAKEDIFDYLAIEIFEKMEPDVQDFLLRSAYLPQMTHKMLENFLGHQKGGRILTDLLRDNCFMEEYLQSEKVYRYHPLFREFLLMRGREFFQEDDLSYIQNNAAVVLKENGFFEDAAMLFCRMSEWDSLAEIIQEQAHSLIFQGKNQTLEEWLSSIPENIFEHKPWFLYWKGLCLLPSDPGESYCFLERAFQIFSSKDDALGIFLSWASAVEALVHDSNFTSIDKWIKLFEELIQRFPFFPSEEIEARVASSMFIAMVLRRPQHPEITLWAEALAHLPERVDRNVRIKTLAYLAWYRMLKGDFAGASIALNSLRVIMDSFTVSPFHVSKVKEVEALYFWLTADHDRCRISVSEGMEVSYAAGIQRTYCSLLGHGAANALSKGDVTSAKRLLHKMALSLEKAGFRDKSFYYFLRAWEAMLKKNMVQALINGETAIKYAVDAGTVHFEALCYLMKAQALYELGEQRKAEDELDRARDIGIKIQSQLVEFMSNLVESQFAFDRGEEQDGTVSLRNAMAIGRRQGYINTFLLRTPVMARLCERALERGIEFDYVQNLIRRRGLVHDALPLHVESWPWPLKIFTLGRFSLLRDGKPVRFSGKVQKKPLSLLKALITLGGREVTEEQLLDILWYDADGDIAHKSFATTLHRLRKLVGNERIIKLREGRLTLDTRYCWVDVWTFERLLGQINAAWKEGTEENKVKQTIQLAEKAIEIYKGPFLSGEADQPWTISYRERLRSKFLRIVRKVGLYWEDVGNYEKAVECYQKGLEVDDLAEEFYQRLMICYLELGRKAEALTVYNRCRNTLSMVLGVEPSPSTEALGKKFLSDKT